MRRFANIDTFFCSVLLFSVVAVLATAHRHHRHQGHHSDSDVHPGASSEISGSRQSVRRSTSEEGRGERGSNTDNSTSESDAGRTSRSGNCSQCGIREAKRDYRLNSVKAEILRKLRLSSLPNVTGRRLPDIPQLRKIIDDHRYRPTDLPDNATHPTILPDEEYDDTFATTLKYVLFAQPAPAVVAGNASNIFCFQFQSEMSHQQIVIASINIYVRQTTNPRLNATWLLLYQLDQLPSTPGESQKRDTMRKRRIQMSSLRDSGQWITFDIKSYVERWISLQNVSYGIMVQVSDGMGEPLAVIHPQTPEEADRKPYLIIHVRDQGTSRSKRMTENDCPENSVEHRCCRYPLTVDFEQFRWDWVIVPKRYSAYYCSGECSFHYYQSPSHTDIAQQVTKLPGTAGGPCCSPRKVSAISMLYYDEFMNIVYGRLPGMVVDQCGCS